MAVYAFCEICKCRRDKATSNSTVECADKSAHKKHVAWIADVRIPGQTERPRKVFRSGKDHPKEQAERFVRQVKTDYDRGNPYGVTRRESKGFSEVVDEWWQRAAIIQNKFKDPRRVKYRVDMFKQLFENRLISVITETEIESWIVDRRKGGTSPATINSDLKPLRWIFNFAVEKQYLVKSPLAKIAELKGEGIHDRWMTEAEVDALIKAAYDLGDHDLVDFIDVGVNTGFRLANLMRLTAKDFHENLIEARKTKSDVPYTVPIADDLEPTVRRLLHQRPTGLLLNTINIGRRFRRAVKKAGLYTNNKDLERVTIHTLRHTFAVLYLQRGGDIYKLRNLLGHANSAITEKTYARFSRKDKEAQAALISTKIQRPTPQFKIA